MRAVIQRVSRAEVIIASKQKAAIDTGLLVFLGIEESDSIEDADWLCSKISKLRIFPDNEGVMNLSIDDIHGEVLVVSQFTLHALTKKGNRPSYIRAASPEIAIPLYNYFLSQFNQLLPDRVKSGVFGAMMQIQLCNEGPVTIIIDTKNKE